MTNETNAAVAKFIKNCKDADGAFDEKGWEVVKATIVEADKVAAEAKVRAELE